MPFARDDLDSNLVSIWEEEEEELLMVATQGEPQLQALADARSTGGWEKGCERREGEVKAVD